MSRDGIARVGVDWWLSAWKIRTNKICLQPYDASGCFGCWYGFVVLIKPPTPTLFKIQTLQQSIRPHQEVSVAFMSVLSTVSSMSTFWSTFGILLSEQASRFIATTEWYMLCILVPTDVANIQAGTKGHSVKYVWQLGTHDMLPMVRNNTDGSLTEISDSWLTVQILTS